MTIFVRRGMFAAAVLLGSLLVFGLVGAAAESDEPVMLRMCESAPTYIDPAVGSDFSSSMAFANLYDSLIEPKPDGSIGPFVAESWEVSDDAMTFTFKIRPGIYFHDQSELYAEDVAFSLNRLLAIGKGYAYLFSSIARAEAVDLFTLRVIMKEKFGPLVPAMARLYIVNKELVMANLEPGGFGDFQDYGESFLAFNDAGSGPYSVEEHNPEQFTTMVKFDTYWHGFVENAPDIVEILLSVPSITQRNLLLQRELEISDQYLPKEVLRELEQVEGISATEFFDSGFYVTMNCQKPPTDDIHVRRAISWAVDYDSVIEYIYPGSIQMIGPVPQFLPGAAADLFQYHQDPEKAKEELKLSKYYGQLDQYPIELSWIAETPTREKVALLVKRDLEKIGLKVNVVKTPWSKTVQDSTAAETTPHLNTIIVAPHYSEAGSMLESKYPSWAAGSWESTEWLLNKEVDELIAAARTTTDLEQRFAFYHQVQELLVDLVPDVFLFDMRNEEAYQSGYVEWHDLKDPVSVMGYVYDASRISVYPEKREALLK